VATSRSSSVCARFDQFQVDLSSGDLRTAASISVRIQQQPLQVLRLLLAVEGRVVTREQLRVALWPGDTFVDFEHGVNTAVKKLRQVLGDSVESPKFIETVPKVGYRFLVPVEWVTDLEDKRQPHTLPSGAFLGRPTESYSRFRIAHPSANPLRSFYFRSIPSPSVGSLHQDFPVTTTRHSPPMRKSWLSTVVRRESPPSTRWQLQEERSTVSSPVRNTDGD
jgi:DNA-binding winged helix-turn-helix (wHTH) protein